MVSKQTYTDFLFGFIYVSNGSVNRTDIWQVKNPVGISAFGTHLRRIREAKDMSQQELANICDIAKITIQRIENAKFSVTLDVLISLSKGLKMPLKELLDFSLPREKSK